MTETNIAPLENRGIVAVTGADAVKYLNGLVTNEVAHLIEGSAASAGLLSPQGKILFDFLALRTPSGFLLDVARDKAADLIKRLTLYKLRAAVTITDGSEDFSIWALWGNSVDQSLDPNQAPTGGFLYRDPRATAMGWRILGPRSDTKPALPEALNAHVQSSEAYHRLRVALGVPEGDMDYEFGDAYPHEADFDLFHGLSFTKGCYVGQEVVSRMQHKTVVRKRVVRISGDAEVAGQTDITMNDIVIGRTGTVTGQSGLALIRLDRYADALKADIAVSAGPTRIRIHEADFERYVASVAARGKA